MTNEITKDDIRRFIKSDSMRAIDSINMVYTAPNNYIQVYTSIFEICYFDKIVRKMKVKKFMDLLQDENVNDSDCYLVVSSQGTNSSVQICSYKRLQDIPNVSTSDMVEYLYTMINSETILTNTQYYYLNQIRMFLFKNE